MIRPPTALERIDSFIRKLKADRHSMQSGADSARANEHDAEALSMSTQDKTLRLVIFDAERMRDEIAKNQTP